MPNVDSQSPDCSPLPKRQCSPSGGLPARRIQRRTSNDEGAVREALLISRSPDRSSAPRAALRSIQRAATRVVFKAALRLQLSTGGSRALAFARGLQPLLLGRARRFGRKIRSCDVG